MPSFFTSSNDNPYTVTLMKSVDSYGVRVFGLTVDPLIAGGLRNTRPVICFYDAFTKAIIDYSHTTNQIDAAYLEFLQSAATGGTNLILGNASYYNALFNTTVDLGGTYTVSGITNDGKVILATLGFSFAGYDDVDRYVPSEFVGIPSLDSPSLTGNTVSYIENLTANPELRNFMNLGVYGSEFALDQMIEISGSTLNSGRIAVTKYAETNDGKQFIYMSATMTNENLYGRNTEIVLYERGSIPGYIQAENTTDDGTVKIFDEDGEIVACFENQNQRQAYVKKYAYPDDTILWQENATCETFIREEALDIDELFSNWDCSYALVALDEVTLGVWWLINNSYRATISVSSSFSAVKLDVSHYSLAGSYIYVSSSISPANEITTNISRSGTPGTPGAAIFLRIDSTLPNPVYIISSNTGIGQSIELSYTNE